MLQAYKKKTNKIKHAIQDWHFVLDKCCKSYCKKNQAKFIVRIRTNYVNARLFILLFFFFLLLLLIFT